MLRYRYCFVTLYLRAISKYKPPGANIRRGDLTDFFFFCVTSLGVLYLEGLIFGILRYNVPCEANPSEQAVTYVTNSFNSVCSLCICLNSL